MRARHSLATGVVAALWFFVLSSQALADRIVLKNGQVIEGRIVMRGQEMFGVRKTGGGMVVIQRADIASIQEGGNAPAERPVKKKPKKPSATPEELLAEGVKDYGEQNHRGALEAFYAYALQGQQAGQLDEYLAKAKEQLGVDLGKVMASCRMTIKCRRCKGDGGHSCKSCGGDGRKQDKKRRVIHSNIKGQISVRTIRWTEPRPCGRCKGTGYRFCKACDGTCHSLINPKKGSKLALLDFERQYIVPLLLQRSQILLAQITPSRGSTARRSSNQQGQQGGAAQQGVKAFEPGDPFEPDAIDVQDLALASRATRLIEEAVEISASTQTKISIQQKLNQTRMVTQSFSDLMEARWKQEAAENRQKALGTNR